MDNSNKGGNTLFLQTMFQKMKDSAISYHIKNTYTDSLLYMVQDSTNIQSIYAENILRLTDEKYYPFRIPNYYSSSYKTQPNVIRNEPIKLPNSMVIYPNPNIGEFTIALNEKAVSDAKRIDIYDMIGKKIYTEKVLDKKTSYSVKLYNSKGTYIVRIMDKYGKEIDSKKITIK